jgi:hypothetical protein
MMKTARAEGNGIWLDNVWLPLTLGPEAIAQHINLWVKEFVREKEERDIQRESGLKQEPGRFVRGETAYAMRELMSHVSGCKALGTWFDIVDHGCNCGFNKAIAAYEAEVGNR